VAKAVKSIAPTEAMQEKARLAAHTTRARHLFGGFVIPMYTDVFVRPEPRHVSLFSATEQTARYLGALAFRAAAEGRQAEAGAAVETTLAALERAHAVTGVPGVMARGYLPEAAAEGVDLPSQEEHLRRTDGHVWLSGANSYTYCGVFFGCAVLHDTCATDPQRQRIAALLGAVLDRLLEANFVVTDAEGNQVENYVLTPGKIPVRRRFLGLHALHLLIVGHHVTGDARYLAEYRRLAVEHEYAKKGFQLPPGFADDEWGARDDMCAFEAYYHLLRYDNDPDLAVIYRRNMAAVGAKVRGQERAYLDLIYQILEPESEAARDVAEVLARMPVVKEFHHGGACDGSGPYADSPVPIVQRPPVMFEWAYAPRRSWAATTYLAPVDYLAAYWMARYHGIIAAPESG
jgi:hypothetical protein